MFLGVVSVTDEVLTMVEDMKYENKNGTPNEVGVTDELGVEMIKQQLLNLYAEQKAFEEGLETAVANLENFEKQWKIDKELYDLQMEHFGLNEDKYTHKVHFVPKYWELLKEQFYYSKVRPETFQSEKMIESYKSEIEVSEKRLVSLAEEILTVSKQLRDLGEEVPQRDPVED